MIGDPMREERCPVHRSAIENEDELLAGLSAGHVHPRSATTSRRFKSARHFDDPTAQRPGCVRCPTSPTAASHRAFHVSTVAVTRDSNQRQRTTFAHIESKIGIMPRRDELRDEAAFGRDVLELT